MFFSEIYANKVYSTLWFIKFILSSPISKLSSLYTNFYEICFVIMRLWIAFDLRWGWKVHKLTKKELSHNNETGHALNSTFPDTTCTVSFQINPHLISISRLWKVLETFKKRPGKLTKRVLFHRDNAPANKTVYVVAMAAVRDCGFKLVDHPHFSPDLAPSGHFLKKNTWPGSSIALITRSYL